MYLDHLKNSTSAAPVNGATFMECMEAALYCTEVHASADAYLIKAEAEYIASEAAGVDDSVANPTWWDKIKTVIKKMWEALKSFISKVISFVASIPSKIVNIYHKIATKFTTMGMESKAKERDLDSADAEKLKDVYWVDDAVAFKMTFDLIKAICSLADKADYKKGKEEKDTAFDAAKEDIETKIKNMREYLDDPKKVGKAIKKSDVTSFIGNISKIGADNAKRVKEFEGNLSGFNKQADEVVKEFQTAYAAKDEDKVKYLTKKLSKIRTAVALSTKAVNAYAVFLSKTAHHNASAAAAYIAACKESKKK